MNIHFSASVASSSETRTPRLFSIESFTKFAALSVVGVQPFGVIRLVAGPPIDHFSICPASFLTSSAIIGCGFFLPVGIREDAEQPEGDHERRRNGEERVVRERRGDVRDVVVDALARRAFHDRDVVSLREVPRRGVVQAWLVALGLRLRRLVGKRALLIVLGAPTVAQL